MADDFGYEIAPLESPDLAEALRLIDEVMGPGHDEEWFRWKHRDNPAGRSLAWVARDDDGLVGVRLIMRWDLARGTKRLAGFRPVDTVTAPRARRRGIFSSLVLTAKESLPTADDGVVFNTPNARSRGGYRRLGWTLMEPIPHLVTPLLPGRGARLRSGAEVLDAFDHDTPAHGRIRTHRTAGYARWRYDQRSGREYSFASLEQADEANAIVYRIVDGKVRLLVVSELTGSMSTKKALVKAAGRAEGARVALVTGGKGGEPTPSRPSLQRGSSVVAVHPMASAETGVTSVESWALTLGDLEDVI